ncbi:MAG TPA: transposase [Bryobacteraceae bacterium]|nr:transposase [Bryobacteraceae bacterium]
MDRLLDASQSGPRWLAEARIAVLVRDSIYHCGVTDYDLHAWVIMPNHVHMLITPRTLPSRFMRRLKGFTARQANAILFRAGKPFWQDETYDHVVRSPREFHLTANYIAENPVKAGLVRAAEEFRWSSVASIRG